MVVEVDTLLVFALLNPQDPLGSIADVSVVRLGHVHEAIRFDRIAHLGHGIRRELGGCGFPRESVVEPRHSMKYELAIMVQANRVESMPAAAAAEFDPPRLVWINLERRSFVLDDLR